MTYGGGGGGGGGRSAAKLAAALADETTVIVGAEGGDVIHATALEVAGACVDTEGVGTHSRRWRPSSVAARHPAGELGHIWCRIRSTAFESPKHNVELLDAQLFPQVRQGRREGPSPATTSGAA